jgi:type IV secretory pathway VirB6-like protein
VTADDIPVFAAPVAAPSPRRRWWPWLLGLALLVLLLVSALGALLIGGLLDGLHDGVHVTLDGERWDFHDGPAAVLGIALALLITLLVVPLVLVVTVLAVVLALVVAGGAVAAVLGTALCALLVVLALATSPLWLLGLLLWLMLKPSRPANAAQ